MFRFSITPVIVVGDFNRALQQERLIEEVWLVAAHLPDSAHVRPRCDKHGVDLLSDAWPFGREEMNAGGKRNDLERLAREIGDLEKSPKAESRLSAIHSFEPRGHTVSQKVKFSSPFLLKHGSLLLVIENAREILFPTERAYLTNQPIPRLGKIIRPFF